MTYEERRKFFCDKCQQISNFECACRLRHLEFKCITLDEKMEGWKLGFQDAVEAAIEFVYQRQAVDLEVPYIEKLIEDFKKYMMEEQL